MDKSSHTICGLREIEKVSQREFTHIVSIGNPETKISADLNNYKYPSIIKFRFHDIIEPKPGYLPPSAKDINDLLNWTNTNLSSERDFYDLLVHCNSGISRSTSFTIVILCLNDKKCTIDNKFEYLRKIRPKAWPNSLIIKLADDSLGMNGNLMAALGRHYAYQVTKYPALARLMKIAGREREVNQGLKALQKSPL